MMAQDFYPDTEAPTQGFADVLGTPTPQAPDTSSGGFSEMLSGAGNAVADGWKAASSWIKDDPKKAQMLMHVFTTLAMGGHGNRMQNIGAAVNAGNAYGIMQDQANQAQNMQERQFALKKDEAAMKNKQTEANITNQTQQTANQTQQTANQTQQTDNQGKNIESEIAARSIGSEATAENTTQSRALFDTKKQKLQTDIALMTQQIASAKTSDERMKAEIQLKKLELKDSQLSYEYKQKFGDAEHQVGLDQKRAQIGATTASTAHTEASTVGQNLNNMGAEMKIAALAEQPADVRAGVMPARPHTTQERFQQFYKTYSAAKAANFEQPDIQEALRQFQQQETALANGGGTPTNGQQSVVRTPTAPAPGTVSKGYKFKGGDPANPNSWEKV